MKSPVEQFTIKTLVPLSLWVRYFIYKRIFIYGFVSNSVPLFLYLGIKKSSLIPKRFQSSVELLYEFVPNMVKENVGNGGKKIFSRYF